MGDDNCSDLSHGTSRVATSQIKWRVLWDESSEGAETESVRKITTPMSSEPSIPAFDNKLIVLGAKPTKSIAEQTTL